MLTLKSIAGVRAFRTAYGLSQDGGACFGVTDFSRLRPRATPLAPLPPQKKRVPAMHPAKKKK